MSATVSFTIEAMGSRGEGIARHEDATFFVAGALPGEVVRARIEGQRGLLDAVVAPSPERIAPFCPHFGACGGCQVQHWAPEPYRQWKRGLAVTALERAGLEAQVRDLVDAQGEGRRRVTLHATPHGAGFMGLRSHAIHEIEHCPILVPGLAEAPALARAIAEVLGLCDVAITDTAMGPDVAVRIKRKPGFAPRKLAEAAERFGVCRVAINGEVVLSYASPSLAIGTAEVPLPVGGFLQATARAEAVLADLVLEAAAGGKAVADLFCGIGPFALRLARHAPIYAADTSREAVAALEQGFRTGKKLKAVTVEARDLFADPLTRFELDRFDTVVLDPPRAGAQAQTKALAQTKRVGRVISVSCDPLSFARDAAILVASGFAMGPVTPVDQFAWSSHLELVACFTRR